MGSIPRARTSLKRATFIYACMWQQRYLDGISSPSCSLQAVCALAGILIVTALWIWKDTKTKQPPISTWQDDWQELLTNRAHKLIVPQNPDGKVHMDLITQQGIQPLDVNICKNPDGTDWLLGVGGYSEVYKAQRPDGQEVAVKVLHNADKVRLQMFAMEVKVLMAVISHPNVVQFHGACLRDNLAMIVLEYMEGGDLHEALMSVRCGAQGAGLLSWNRQGAKLALDIAKGLEFLHARKIVHCDIKTKNVLLNKGCSIAKLADCGVSRLLDSHAFSSTGTSTFRGTLAYAAPELLLGSKCTDKVDMYSFGVLLWEIITHEKPFRGQLRDFKFKQGRGLLLKHQGYLTARRTRGSLA
ncbi:hypothetical protein WJX79_004186 [Trebouxia sp. C0005]